MMVRPVEKRNLVRELQREPQAPAVIRGFREICKVAANVGVAALNSCERRRTRDLNLDSSRMYTTKAMTALNFYGHRSPRC